MLTTVVKGDGGGGGVSSQFLQTFEVMFLADLVGGYFLKKG
jgi:hypothetical protein